MTGERPLVIHVTTTSISLELLLGPQLEALVHAGYDVVGASAPGDYVAALEARGIRHEPLHHATRAMAPGEDLRALLELIKLFRRLRPTVVHTHNPKPGLYGRVAAAIARVPVVVNTVHGLYALPDDPAPKRAVVYGLERLASTFSDAELLQNEEDLLVLRRWRVPARKISVLGNGIDLTRFDAKAVHPDDVERARAELGATGPDDVVVGLVGRLVHEKGYLEVFEAARALRADHPNLRVAVIGPEDPDKSGSLTPQERADAERIGVRFLGSRTDMAHLYSGMDIHVLASHREGFPRAAMEAAAMGLPIVATDVRGCRQVVEHEVTGLLVPRADPAALAAAISALVADPDRRRRMGQAASAKAAAEFDQDRCIDHTLATYQRLLPPTRPANPSSSVRHATEADAAGIGALHAEAIHEGFLPTLGPRFLRRLYRRIVRSDDAMVFVTEDDQGITGFVAIATNTSSLYRDFLLHDGLMAALAAAPALAASPRRSLETLRYGFSSGGQDGRPEAEVLATAVAQRARRTGIGARLLTAATDGLRDSGVLGACVVTASDNRSAQRMYERAGFIHLATTEVHAGVRQEVLVWH